MNNDFFQKNIKLKMLALKPECKSSFTIQFKETNSFILDIKKALKFEKEALNEEN